MEIFGTALITQLLWPNWVARLLPAPLSRHDFVGHLPGSSQCSDGVGDLDLLQITAGGLGNRP